jgi:hypothetical protein
LRTSRSVLAGATALALLAIAPATPATAAPPSPPHNVITLSGGFEDVATPAIASPFRIFPYNGTNGFRMDASFISGGHWYDITIGAPTGQDLAIGMMSTLGTADATHGYLDVSGNGRACDDSAGMVIIHELVRDAENAIVSVAASYKLFSCFGVDYPVWGSLRWNSSVGYFMAQANTRSLDFGDRNAGEDSPAQTVTFKSMGSARLAMDPPTITGANPDAFSVTADSCSVEALDYEQTCSISAKAHPTAVGYQNAKLEMPSSTPGGKEVVNLTVRGVKSARGTYHAVYPTRILDTRNGTGARAEKVGPTNWVEVPVSTFGGVPPSGVAAVVLNVTVTEPTASGHITVWPTGVARPNASSLNFVPGWTGANSVTVGVGAGGKVSLFNSAGNTHLIADVVGYYLDSSLNPSAGPGGLFHPGTPFRRLDTRTWPFGKLGPGYSALLRTNFGEGNAHIKAWVVNITATESEGPGYVTAWNGDGPPPNASNLNLAPGKTVPNFAIVPSRRCWECPAETYGWQTIEVFTSNTTHLIVDMFALYDDGSDTDGLRLEPNTPTRIVDSRFAQGTPGPLGQGQTATITTPGGLLGATTDGLALNVTAITPTGNTFMTVWGGDGIAQPVVSNLNPHVGQIIPNAVATLLDSQHRFKVYNNAGTTNFVVDVVGTFYWYPYLDPTAAARSGSVQQSSRYTPGETQFARRQVN